MKLALFGYGSVGKAFVRLLNDKAAVLQQQGLPMQLNYVIGRSGGLYSPDGIDTAALAAHTAAGHDWMSFAGADPTCTAAQLVQNGDVDMAVVLTPTNKESGEPGLSIIRTLLAAGIHVATGDKGPILLAYDELCTLAAQTGAQLGIGCTTGGALPSVNAGLIDLAGGTITAIEGILTGTTNFILKDMEERGVNYEPALKKMQDAGIAERDPSLDVDGWDTAIKLLILSRVHMGVRKTLRDIDVQGITGLCAQDIAAAAAQGKRYKLIGRAQMQPDGSVSLTVRPEAIGPEHLLYGVTGKNKAVLLDCDTLGQLAVIGGASGVTPAAASCLRDIVNIARGYRFIG